MLNFDNATTNQIATAGLTQDEVMELVKRGYVKEPSVASQMFKYAASKDPNQTQDAQAPVETIQESNEQSSAPPMTDNTIGAPGLTPEQFQIEQDTQLLEQQNRVEQGRNDLLQALDQRLMTQNSDADKLSAAYEQQNNAIANVTNDMAQFQKEQANAYDKAFAEHEAAKQEAAEFIKNKKGFWESRTDGQKAMALIAIALGGFIEGYTEGRVKNAGLAAVEKNIKEYIVQQEQQYNAIKDKQEAAKTLFGMIQQRTNDTFATKKIMMELGLESTKNTIESLAKGSQAKAKSAELIAEIEDKKLKLEEERLKNLQEKEVSKTEIEVRGLDPRYIEPRDPEKRRAFVNGFGVAIGGKEQAKEIYTQTISPARKALNAIDRLIELADTNALNTLPKSEISGEIASIIVGLRAASAPEVIGTGARSESDKVDLNMFISNPTDWANILSKKQNLGKLKAIARGIMDNTEDLVVNYGGMRLSPEFEQWKDKYGTYSMKSSEAGKQTGFAQRGTPSAN